MKDQQILCGRFAATIKPARWSVPVMNCNARFEALNQCLGMFWFGLKSLLAIVSLHHRTIQIIVNLAHDPVGWRDLVEPSIPLPPFASVVICRVNAAFRQSVPRKS